jgi:hypothetical protein
MYVRRANMRAYRILRPSDLEREDNVEPSLLADARARGIVAARLAPDPRYSLDEVCEMIGWDRAGRPSAQPASSAGEAAAAPARERRDRLEAIQRYLREEQRPCDLPDWFWEAIPCPPFVPPLGVFKSACSANQRLIDGHVWTEVICSEVYPIEKRGTELFPPSTQWILGNFKEGFVPEEDALVSRNYELAEQEWRAEWARRQPR